MAELVKSRLAARIDEKIDQVTLLKEKIRVLRGQLNALEKQRSALEAVITVYRELDEVKE